MKKYAVSIARFLVDESGSRYGLIVEITMPQNIIEINTPPNMAVNRVTFQVSNNGLDNIGAFLINTRPPMDGNDGVKIVTIPFTDGTNIIGYGLDSYTFENFNSEEITQTFYVANISRVPFDLIVIFEGFNK